MRALKISKKLGKWGIGGLLLCALLSRCEMKTIESHSEPAATLPSGLFAETVVHPEPNKFHVKITWRGLGNRPYRLQRAVWVFNSWSYPPPGQRPGALSSELTLKEVETGAGEYLDVDIQSGEEYHYQLVDPTGKLDSQKAVVSVPRDLVIRNELTRDTSAMGYWRVFIYAEKVLGYDNGPPIPVTENPGPPVIVTQELISEKGAEIRFTDLTKGKLDREGKPFIPQCGFNDIFVLATTARGELTLSGDRVRCKNGIEEVPSGMQAGFFIIVEENSPFILNLKEGFSPAGDEPKGHFCYRNGSRKMVWDEACESREAGIRVPPASSVAYPEGTF